MRPHEACSIVWNCRLHSFDSYSDVSAKGRYARASLIRTSKNLPYSIRFYAATSANEHPCAVALLGDVHVPSLPGKQQVLRSSNAFCSHICLRRTSSEELSNFATTVLKNRNGTCFTRTPCSATEVVRGQEQYASGSAGHHIWGHTKRAIINYI